MRRWRAPEPGSWTTVGSGGVAVSRVIAERESVGSKIS
jgi:hypothetical protein